MGGRRRVILDPGVVFGTGQHPTTHACLDLIHQVCLSGSIDTVLDIGTGTGLLAMGAAAMGCTRVLGFQARGETMLDLPCDLLVANIHYDIMRQLMDSPAFEKKPWIILSGLLRTEARHVADGLAHKNMNILEHRCPDGIWHTFLVRPRAPVLCWIPPLSGQTGGHTIRTAASVQRLNRERNDNAPCPMTLHPFSARP
jgi:ribosomal protein L11 methyltransferase